MSIFKKDVIQKYFDKTDSSFKTSFDNLIQKSIDRVNVDSPNNTSKIQKFIVLNNDFTIGKEITSTLKIRRSFIEKTYKKNIDSLYN